MSLEQLAAGAACAADLANEIDAKHTAATTNNNAIAEAKSSVRVQVSNSTHIMYILCTLLMVAFSCTVAMHKAEHRSRICYNVFTAA
jgi:hypothetical protein